VADYTDLDSVRGVMPGGVKIDSYLTRPDLATVALWITQVSNTVNAALSSGGVSLPVTDADLLGALKLLCSHEVAYQIMLTRGAVDDSRVPPMWKTWHDDFLKALDLMRKGEYSATLVVDDPWSYTQDANPDDSSDSKNPTFTKDYEP